MSDEDSQDDEVPSRSRQTLWRREGSKKRRYHQLYNDSDNSLSPPPQNPREEEDDDDGLPQNVNAAAADFQYASTSSLVSHSHHLRSGSPVEDADSNSDSCWSEDLQNNPVEEEEESDDEDPEPLSGEEHDFFIEVEGDNPDEPDDADQNTSAESNDDEDAPAFNLQYLSRVLEFEENRTVKDSLLLDLALSVRYKMNYECLIQNFRTRNFLMGQNLFPKNSRQLFKLLGRRGSGIRSYVYCSGCNFCIGRKKNLSEIVECPNCHLQKRKQKASFFVSLDIKKQLEHFLSLPGVASFLEYRENRIKRVDGAIEDIFDGIEYQKIEVDGKKLMNSNNYSYVFNTDGCKIRKGGKLSIYPLFLRINELPPQLRQKFMILAGVFVDNKEPNMVSFLQPFVSQMNRLSETGIVWTRNGEEVVSKFVPTCFCVDGKARAQMLNMVSHVGHYACSHCTYYGVSVNRTMRYPTQHEDLPPSQPRSHGHMIVDMVNCSRGFKGVTSLALLKGLDLTKGAATDDLHYFYECASLQHTELLLTSVPRIDRNLSFKGFLDTIDSRLRSIKTPNSISRKPGTCKMKNRRQKKGSEWRNWLLYYGPICLQNLIPTVHIQHFERLSHAAYLLSQDVILVEEIDRAERLIEEYLSLYDEYFGIENTRLNLHSLCHAADSVRNWGGLWCYSTFNFESWNHKVMQLVSSPNGALQQIVTRHLIQSILLAAMYADGEVPHDVVNRMKEILNKKRYVNAQEVGQQIYVMGLSDVREPTCEELQVLQYEGLNASNMKFYKKIIIKSLEFTSASNETRSDNTSIFTFQNTFCTIKSIVTFNNQEDGSEICGLFVWEHEVAVRDRPLFAYAKHIVQIRDHDADLLHFLRADQVRSPVVKAEVLGDRFFVAVPNSHEID